VPVEAGNTLETDDQQKQPVTVLLLDGCESGAGADRVPADASLPLLWSMSERGESDCYRFAP
jgi:hypothetical protein